MRLHQKVIPIWKSSNLSAGCGEGDAAVVVQNAQWCLARGVTYSQKESESKITRLNTYLF